METDKKKIIIIGLGVMAILAGLSLATFVLFKPKQEEPISPAIKLEKPEEILAPLVTWSDPAGFSFAYPSNLQIDPHQEDKENYAHLELREENHAGGIIIWMKDTNYKTIDDWAKKESGAASWQIFETTLGGREAKKVAYKDGRVTTAALDEEVIVLLELFGDNQFWQPVYEKIIESFEFIPLAQASPPATSGEIWEEEEIVE